MPTVELPFAIGQQLYFINVRPLQKEENCPACNGTGTFQVSSKERYQCPSIFCKKGKIRISYDYCWRIGKVFTVESVNITRRMVPFYYFEYGDSHGSYPENLFETEELALVTCDIRNKKDGFPVKNDEQFYQWKPLEHQLVPIG